MDANRAEEIGKSLPQGEVEKPYSREGYALMGAAFEVHRELGGGLAEEIYQQCLELELTTRSIPFQAKEELIVFYKGRQLVTKYKPDVVAFDSIIVELKSVAALCPGHEAQLMNYMRVTRKPVGYLINFGPISKVEWKRFVISDFL